MKIIDFFIAVNNVTNRNAFSVLNKIKFYSIVRYLNRNIAYVVLRIIYSITKSGRHNQIAGNKFCPFIVSLTSFPARIDNLDLTLETILRQELKPFKILVYLSKEQIRDRSFLSQRLLGLEKRGVEFVFVDGDIKSHKKYYYVLRDF